MSSDLLEDSETHESLHNFGIFLSTIERYDEAEQILRKVVTLREQYLDPEDSDLLAHSLSDLGSILAKKSCTKEAYDFYQQALRIMLNNFDDDEPETLEIQERIAELSNIGK